MRPNRKHIVVTLGVIVIVFAAIVNYQDRLFYYRYSEKIWIHKVNSLEKLHEVTNRFSGVELDVVFESSTSTFDVNHPPDLTQGLTLHRYFSSMDSASDRKQYWLDFKNLSRENSEAALDRINEICNEFELEKNGILIESTNPRYLKPFSEVGFKTSYYLPPDLVEMDEADYSKTIESIKQTIEANQTDYISTNRKDFDIIKNEFPDARILTWSFNYKNGIELNPIELLRDAKSMYMKYKILSDDKVNVVLFEYQGV